MTLHIDLTTGTVTRSADAAGRTLHLVDIENLSGGPQRTPAEHAAAYRAYERRAELRTGDQVVVAACGRVMRDLAFSLPSGIARRVANGDDGADRVLLGFGTAEFIAERFERLVIGSGDHGFLGLALAAQALGVHVVILSGRGFRSATLQGRGFGIRSLGALRLDEAELELIA
jgi:hypothetical protein